MFTRILLDPQGGEGNGEIANDGGEGKTDLSVMAAGMIARKGDAAKVVIGLLRENHGYRAKIRAAEAKVPGEGSVILTGDDAKRYQAYQSLGDDPKAIGEALKAGQSAITERDGLVREKVYTKAASLGGLKEAPFRRLAANEGLNVVIKDVMKDGKEVQVAYVVNPEGKETLLDDHVKTQWSDFHDSLGYKAETRKAGMPGRANDNTPPPRPGGGSTSDHARDAYLRSMGRIGL